MKKKAIKKRGRPRKIDRKAIKKRARPIKIEPNDNVYIGFNISKGTLNDFDEVCKAQFRTRTGQLNFLMEAAIMEHKYGN